MSFNFTKLEKGKYGGFSTLQGKILRKGPRGMSISYDAVGVFGEPSKTSNGDDKLELAIGFDNVQQAIKLTRSQTNGGYAFFKKSLGGTYHVNMGKYMQRMLSSMPEGDYVADPSEPTVFVLAR